MRHGIFLIAVFWSMFHLSLATAQTAAPASTLLADRIEIQGDTLVASGQVTIWLGPDRLTAQRLVYDRAAQTMQITGPIRVTSADGITILSSSAQLDASVRTAILRDARVIFDDRVQMAAAEVRRPDDRYTEMFKVATTSCYVYKGQTPIWQIRARRIVHDRQEKQIYLESAQLRLFDFPVFYLPWVRLPDPSLERAAGFLIPEIESNTQLGVGLKVPYFIPIGDHRDLTLTPYLSSKTNTLEFRYRQAFSNGNMNLTGAITNDDILEGTRGYVEATANFVLPREYRLELSAIATKDPGYLSEYDYSTEDRLHSYAEIARTEMDGHVDVRLSTYKSLRASENNATIPTVVFEGFSERRFEPDAIGGDATVELSFQTSYRYSNTNTDGPDTDTEVDGFDVIRTSIATQWDRNWVSDAGILTEVGARAAIDSYFISQHIGFPDTVVNSDGDAFVAFSLPMERRNGGSRHLITPKVQFQWGGGTNNNIPNQDSTRVEFDQGNLFALDRSPGYDLSDRGNLTTAGVNWDYWAATGETMGLSLGRIWRDTAPSGFTASSGISGQQSDWLIGSHFSTQTGIDLIARAIVTDAGKLSKTEAQLSVTKDRYALNATYAYLLPDLGEDRADRVSEVALQARYNLQQHWTLSTNLRYDFETTNVSQAEMGLTYRNECIDLNFTVTRRYPSVATSRASNDYGLSVGLLGFGKGPGNTGRTTRTCGG